MLYMALCGEYVRFEKFGFSGCCGGRESLSDTIESWTRARANDLSRY